MLTGPGLRKCVTAHRASYIMAYHKRKDLSMEISHRCHQSLCVNPAHLSHETHEINVEREDCRRFKKCTGHDGVDPCIFKVDLINEVSERAYFGAL